MTHLLDDPNDATPRTLARIACQSAWEHYLTLMGKAIAAEHVWRMVRGTDVADRVSDYADRCSADAQAAYAEYHRASVREERAR